METRERLRKHVLMLAEEIGERNLLRPRALEKAADYIESELASYGYEVFGHEYEVKGIICRNMEATAHAERKKDEIILLGAHYDSVAGCPGANDNASGVAALLEIARLISGEKRKCSVRFVAFPNEEPPLFHTRHRGSLVYAKMARERGDKIKGAIILETIGCYSDLQGSQSYPSLIKRFFPDRGNFIAFVSNLRSRRWLMETAREFRRATDFPAEHLSVFTPLAPGAAWSDHSSFWRVGYRALMVTDTAFYRYPYYHTPLDTPEKIRYEEMAQVTKGIAKAVAAMTDAAG